MRFLFFIFFSVFAFANEYYVIKVHDGDTINVKFKNNVYRVRLHGIDAPEVEQNFGKDCAKLLASKILHKKVNLDVKTTDKYKRKVAIVYLDGLDINRYMVQQGCAWAYTYYDDRYKKDELNARKNLEGLWIDKRAMEPYKFRKMNKYKRSESDEFLKIFNKLLNNEK